MRRAIAFLALFALLFAVAWTRLDRTGERALRDSDERLAVQDLAGAIAEAKLAAQCRGTSWSARGFERLATLADQAEARNDVATMKAAWLASRAAADSIDDAPRKQAADEALVRVAMRADATPATRATEGCSALGDSPCTSSMKLELATPTHPDGASHALLAFAFAVAVAVGVFATRGRKSAAA